MKKNFEEPKMEMLKIMDIVVTSPEGGGNYNNATGMGPENTENQGGGW